MFESISFTLNGKTVSLQTDGSRPLLWVLRTDFQLTATKYGCGEGHCGACTVLVDKQAVRSCQLLLRDVAGTRVVTLEGLSRDGELHPLQQAFIDHDALQCGYCTPGMLMNAAGLLFDNPQPSRSDIITAMDQNLCRCGSYTRILDAIQSAARAMERGEE